MEAEDRAVAAAKDLLAHGISPDTLRPNDSWAQLSASHGWQAFLDEMSTYYTVPGNNVRLEGKPAKDVLDSHVVMVSALQSCLGALVAQVP